MSWLLAIEWPLEVDLAAFSQFLWQQGINHRIVEQAGRQQLWLPPEQDPEQVVRYWQLFQQQPQALPPAPVRQRPSLRWPQGIPVTLTLLLGAALGWALVSWDQQGQWLRQLTFTDFSWRFGQLQFEAWSGSAWRLVTPIFLHFGLLHWAFNSLWLWELGGRIERQHGSWLLAGLTLLIAIASNTAQYLWSGPLLFGGLSGVIYGLLGYCWIWSRLRPAAVLSLPSGVVLFMLIWLVVCMSGVTEWVGLGAIANAAHLSGLLAGMLLGTLAALVAARRQHN